jgi:hypothetical protein
MIAVFFLDSVIGFSSSVPGIKAMRTGVVIIVVRRAI